MKAETAWKWMPAVVLGATLVFGVWRVMIATNDPHFSAVENAYEQGGNWDAHRAEVRAAEALGWKVTLTPGVVIAEGESQNSLAISGPDGAPLEGVGGEVVAYHNAYPKELYRANIRPAAPGEYSFDLPLHQAGQWQWKLRLQRGEDVWVGEKREFVAAGGSK
jgi:nitrogen fixation protein FixH